MFERVLTVLLATVVLTSVVAVHDPDALIPNTDIVPDEYIVVMKAGTNMEALLADMAEAEDDLLHVKHKYSIGEFQGFSLRCNDNTMQLLGTHPDVDYLEQNRIVRAAQESCSRQNEAPWGLARINERALEEILGDKYIHPTNAGEGVKAWIVDTGIDTTNVDFENRAVHGANFVGDGKDTDCNGHGTHVAGTVGGKRFGVSKQCSLVGVKVLGCTGSGTLDGVVAGIDFVASEAKKVKKSGAKGVANMSLGGPKSSAEDAALEAARKAGVVFIVAAGNENQDACNVSPASSSAVVTVGATELADVNGKNEDARAYFSNYGSCVNIFAPGAAIESAWLGVDGVNTISGTSMASPHVAGAAAKFLAGNGDASVEDVEAYLLSDATDDAVDLACANSACRKSPNKMLHSLCA